MRALRGRGRSAPSARSTMLTDEQVAAAALEIDPDRSNVLLFVGNKGSGKSEAARVVFDAWPYDRAVLDVTGDARPDDPTTRILTPPWPATLPAPDPDRDGSRVTAWLRVSPKSDTYEEDQDLALALGLYPRHRNTLVLVDEFAELATASRVPKNTKLGLLSSRHYSLSLLLCCPRPLTIPKLSIQQADRIFIFTVPDRGDREVLTRTMGFPHKLFEQAYVENQARGEHSYLLWDARQRRLLSMPALPLARTHGPRA